MIHSAEDALLDGAKRILIDSNILIAFFDQRHTLHNKVFDRLAPVYISGSEFYYVQPCLLEFKEYWRRKMLTECIEHRLQQGYHLYRKFEKCFVDAQLKNLGKQQLYLNDSQIKELRATLENISQGKGIQYWFDLCHQALTDTVTTLEGHLATTNFVYAKFDDNNLFPLSLKSNWPKWQTADEMQEKYCLSSNDAAILNMTNGAYNIDSFISNDGDALFAIINGALSSHIQAYTFLDTSPYR
jgi:predicted nucleic acid-binding protein